MEAYKYTFSRTGKSHLNIKTDDTVITINPKFEFFFFRPLPEDWTGPINYYRNLPFMRLYSIEPISNQTLLIVGNADPSVSLESVIQSSDLIERFNIKVIIGAQHFPHQEKPEMVNDVILKFLIGKLIFNNVKSRAKWNTLNIPNLLVRQFQFDDLCLNSR